jgi:hypothetical protein
MCPEALQLRMVPIASCLPTQYSPRQECLPPQRNQTLRIKVLRMDGPESHVTQWCLTMRLSDAGVRRRPTKLFYPNHRLPPWLTEDAARDRSNRLLDCRATPASKLTLGSIAELTLGLVGRKDPVVVPATGAQRRLLNTAPTPMPVRRGCGPNQNPWGPCDPTLAVSCADL